MPKEDYIDYVEKKEDFFGFLKNINVMHIGILLAMVIIGLAYYQKTTGKNIINYVVGICIFATFLYVASRSRMNPGIEWNQAEAILENMITKDQQKVDSKFKGRLIFTKRGWLQPYGGNPMFIIQFYIQDYKTGLKTYYIGKIERKTGVYAGCYEERDSLDGKPDINYGAKGYEDNEEEY